MLSERNLFHCALETDVLARTIWGEAGRQGSMAMRAVASVILNRVRQAEQRGRKWWGGTVIQVCQKPHQFRCWDKGDSLHRKIIAVDSINRHFAAAITLAARLLNEADEDITHGATHYHEAGCIPEWAATHRPVAVIGRLVFYKFSDL